MPSLALGTGAGAGKGLEDMLARALAEDKLHEEQAQLAEALRHNQAGEQLGRDTLRENTNLRTDSNASLDADRRERQAQADKSDTRAILNLRPIGSNMDQATMDRELSTGSDPSFYDVRQDPTYEQFDDNSSGDNPNPGPLSTIRFRGTQAGIRNEEQTAKTPAVHTLVKRVMLDGEPIDADYDPTKQTYSYKGQDITGQREAAEQTVGTPSTDKDGNPVVTFTTKRAGTSIAGRLPQGIQSRIYTARGVLAHMTDVNDEIDEADRRGLLGPLEGRWSDFLAGKVGSTGNAANDELLGQLHADLKLLTSGTVAAHFQSRGGQGMMQGFQDMLDTGKFSKAQLKGAIGAMKNWLEKYGQNPNQLPIPGDKSNGNSGVKILSIEEVK